MAKPRDPVDGMLDELGKRRRPGVPLYITAVEVFHEQSDSLDDHAWDALEFVGWKAVADARAYPAEVPVPDVLERIEAGETFDVATYDRADFDTETRARLTIIGFLTVAAERLMRAENES